MIARMFNRYGHHMTPTLVHLGEFESLAAFGCALHAEDHLAALAALDDRSAVAYIGNAVEYSDGSILEVRPDSGGTVVNFYRDLGAYRSATADRSPRVTRHSPGTPAR